MFQDKEWEKTVNGGENIPKNSTEDRTTIGIRANVSI